MAEVWIFRPEQGNKGNLPRRLFRAADFSSIWLESKYQLRAGVIGSQTEVILATDRDGVGFPELFDWQLLEQIDRCRADTSEPSLILVAQWAEVGMSWVPYTRAGYEDRLQEQRAKVLAQQIQQT
ncbi:hypothetical protein [Streptomyces sp. NBC_01304]|uniref:hypothetical protein n=1 Tax=Streptomyces sp. NBC_01304 TaxID=2903818 RepID=UPI002E12F1D0|nr:hypothetical protein OG430_49310 [Streptomyces sp. NBC_01304]